MGRVTKLIDRDGDGRFGASQARRANRRRRNIARITRTSTPLWPRRLEAALPPQDMADPRAFLLR